MTAPLSNIAALDVPRSVVEAEAAFLRAAERTESPSERIAYYLDIRLERHPELLATDADFPGWSEWIAARQDEMNRARKEAS